MANILALLGDALAPADAAVIGTMQGDQAKATRVANAQRQSVLDQMKQTLNDAEVKKDLADAAAASRTPAVHTTLYTDSAGNVQQIPDVVGGGPATPVADVNGNPIPGKVPTTPGAFKQDKTGAYIRIGADGTVTPVLDENGRPVMGPPPTDRDVAAADRAHTQAREDAVAQLNADRAAVPRPSKAPDAPKPVETMTAAGKTFTTGGGAGGPIYGRAVSDSLAYEEGTLQPDRQRLRQVTGGASAAPSPAGGGKKTSSTAPPNAAEWDALAKLAGKTAVIAKYGPRPSQ